MKRILSFVPKKLLVFMALVLVALGVTAAAGAWSPERPTYTIENPADHVTFNSITNNPREGDERAFFELKDAANQQPNGFLHKIDVKDGEEIYLRVYVHNNAASSLNGTNFNGTGVAKNTKLRIWLPSVTDSVMRANAYISADNASPKEVADTADFYDAGGQKFSISYVPGSAVAYNNAVGQAGMKLSDSIVTTGAPLGYTSPNGVFPGCFQYANVVMLKVKVKMQTPDFTVNKQVSKIQSDGKYTWGENATIKTGETVAYQIRFANTGNTQLDNVVLRDLLPKDMKIVPGSTLVKYGSDPTVKPAGNDSIVANGGLNVGSYSVGSGAVLMFKATLDATGATCGKLTNTAEARVNGMVTTDIADVTVDCANKPVFSCDALNLVIGDNRKVTATVNVTAAGGATYKTTSFNFGDKTPVVITDKTTADHTYAADGTYVIAATPSFMVNGTLVDAPSDACVKTVTFKPGQPPVTPPPTEIPNTGAGSTLGLFVGSVLVSAAAYRLWMIRKLS